jgi:hypothetical protein
MENILILNEDNMIIKSMSRKTASFSQLLTYLNKGRLTNDLYTFKHNIYSHKPYYIVKEYHENCKNLKRRVNGNFLFHEIISLKHQNNMTIEEQREMLKDLIAEYVNARADNNMVYGVIHEQHNQVHCHLMISSNEISNNRNKRMSKNQFAEIRTNLENYARAKYPTLEIAEKTKRRARAKARVIDNEVQLKKRTGKKSDRELMKERLQAIFSKSKNPQDFIRYLEAEVIQVYQRGKTFGFLDELTGKKYRLKTLELEKEFAEMDMSFTQATKKSEQNERQKTQRELFMDRIKTILSASKSYDEFQAYLKKEDIYIYRTENGFAFIDEKTDWKYRLETLGLQAEFQSFLDMVNKNSEDKSFADKLKSFGKRFMHEVINDAEHFVTGKKPSRENEIWTQRNAGQRQNDGQKFAKQGLGKLKSEEQEKFWEQIKEARSKNAAKQQSFKHSK